MNYGTPSSSSDSEMASKIKKRFVKNYHAMFDKKKINFLSLNIEDDLFKYRSKRPTFVLRPFLTMINLYVDRLSLKHHEYEMYCTDYPLDYIFS